VGEQTNTGPERYGSWFGDSDGRVFYFGLSPFNTELRRCEAEGGSLCPLRELGRTGDHLIGRFDMDEERFLAPLLVRSNDPEATSSVWDVLVHSNGRIYYTTFWNEFGSVLPDGGDVRHYPGAGDGLNELWEGPGGEIYVTRYLGEKPGIAVFGPDGRLRRELVMPQAPGATICPKSLAVDPNRGDVWFNTDTFYEDGRPVGFDAYRMSAGGEVLEQVSHPLLAFVSFDAAGRGWFVDDTGGAWAVRIVEPDGTTTRVELGPRGLIDVVQDVKHHGDVTVLATWQRRVFAVRAPLGGPVEHCVFPAPPVDCGSEPPLGYTTVVSARDGDVYGTVDCGIRIIRAGAVSQCDWQSVQ
jgi:sugar lactone lactonase YvrE